MWRNSGQDPGGSGNPPHNQELIDLKDQFEQQQTLIAQLKELVRKNEQATVMQEKVDEYAHTLNKMNAIAKRSKLKKANTDNKTEIDTLPDSKRTAVDNAAKEKILLLRQQMEENKAKVAEHDKNQRGLEEMVTQMKAHLDDSQQIITPLNLSLAETNKNQSYSVNSNSEELYNVVLHRDKEILDLTERIHKLEANVLDLQENVKEKDSVIDARTKAITLMSESLSKKGKNTLDALDDTKEQMRKMQENFVSLELEMKSEKQALLNDLELRNTEINNLRVANETLEKSRIDLIFSNSERQEKIANQNHLLEKYKNDLVDYEQKILELTKINESVVNQDVAQKLQTDGEGASIIREAENQKYLDKINEKQSLVQKLESKTEENDEVIKMKKQLDESNKNMIKMKAHNKSKIKELNKKIDAFKKINDSNAEIVRLEAENSKLNQKLAELEEEKGNLQLRLVETDPATVSAAETIKELECRLKNQAELLVAKIETISNLESQIENYKSECVAGQSHLEDAQVTSEISSIRFEEQLEALELQKKEVVQEKEAVVEENKSLKEKLESVEKEKHEVVVKLESYVQENAELVDKLEKLSAEKVSSAESIEIVEGLTQQEKLELEAYQQNLGLASEAIKSSDENLQQNQELNESVNQLTEETSELLQKIELFTVERREVMEKMEALTGENSRLASKIGEIENNRDILAETYEQLQNEKEVLDTKLSEMEKQNEALTKQLQTLEKENFRRTDEMEFESAASKQEIEEYKAFIAIQKQEIAELKVALLSQQNIVRDNSVLNDQMSQLQEQYETLLSENRGLKATLKTNSEIISEKDAIESEFRNAKVLINEFEENMKAKIEEIENYKGILEENKAELISSSGLISKLHTKVSDLSQHESEIAHLNSVITQLSNAVAQLECENKLSAQSNEAVGLLENQLQELKGALKENMRDAEEYETELKNNSKTITALNNELKRLSAKIAETEYLLESKDDEIGRLNEEREENRNAIATLEGELKSKDEHFHKMFGELKEKCVALQNQIQTSTGSINELRAPVEAKLREQERKNREQLEKMKKIAANLKKKSAAYQDLENQHRDVCKKWEAEAAAKAEIIAALESKTESLHSQLVEAEKEFANMRCSFEIKARESEESAKLLSDKLDEVREENGRLLSEISQYVDVNSGLQAAKFEYEARINSLSAEVEVLRSNADAEISRRDVVVANLSEEIETVRCNCETRCNGLQAKIQGLEVVIETREVELTKQRDRANKLAEGLSAVEERRLLLERKATELGAELEEKSSSYEEVSHSEDLLEQRLSALMVHDEIIEKRLRAAIAENQELKGRNEVLSEENNAIKIKVNAAHHKMQQYAESNDRILSLESENERLNRTVADLEIEGKHLRNKCEQALNEKRDEVETLEVELQQQLEQLDNERKNLTVQCEQLNDQVKEYRENQDCVNDEILQCKQELHRQQTDYEERIVEARNLEVENKAVIENANVDIARLRNVVAEIAGQQDELWVARNRLVEYEKQHSELKCQNDELRDRVRSLEKHENELLKTAEAPFQEYARPESRVPGENVATFTWPEQPHDPFDFISRPATLELPETAKKEVRTGENGREVLLEKIKTLEFMLYSVEKEKEDALLHCQELTNELARLVYEKERPSTGEPRAIEFTPRDTDGIQQPVEEPCEAKSAYLCYGPPNSENQCGFGENDDGWVWGPEEVKLEEEYRHRSGTSRLEELEQKVRVFELEREHHLEEIKTAQVKSGKLVKKLRELRSRNEQLHRRTSLGELDGAIQDELKSQVGNLERKVKEIGAELEKEKHEKDSLRKRIDVLATANEKMVEMKEKQDVDIMLWQQRSQELSTKLEQLEWGGDDSPQHVNRDCNKSGLEIDRNTEALQKKVDEFSCTIEELTLDNEDLQTLLEEQRNMRLAAEKSRFVETILENVAASKEELNATIKSNEELREQINDMKIQLESAILQRNSTIEDVNGQINKLQSEYASLNDRCTNLESKNRTLVIERDNLSRERIKLNNALQEKSSQLENLETDMAEVVRRKNELENSAAIAQENKFLLELKNKELEEKLDASSAEFQKKQATVDQISLEWAERVDQRGNDVAESWKLHLESRESEFAQMAQQLRKEIGESEEKCNALVNENSELRKNAEIRNEVERVCELALLLQEKRAECCDFEARVEAVTTELREKNAQLLDSSNSVSVLQQQINEMREELSIKNKDLEECKNKLQVQMYELDEKTREVVVLNRKLVEIEAVKEHKALIDEKQALIDDFRLENTGLRESLDQHEEEQKRLYDIIEEQILNIEHLKKDVFDKSRDYDALVAEIEIPEEPKPPEAPTKEKHVRFANESSKSDEDLAEPVSRAELDLALYMLHQRDVRCEELTVELMQLLEERDTLQLRLSNAIREKEELRSGVNPRKDEDNVSNSAAPPTGAIPKSKAIILGATGTELATEAIENPVRKMSAIDLASKLSQLKTIGYSKDKTLLDEKVQRHLQQLSLMQQHRDVAAMLPAEAASRLVDASYTLSRDVQSPSKVLLNWLWGRSTPKVNNI